MENLFEFWNTMSSFGKIEFIAFVGAMIAYITNMVVKPNFIPHPIAFGIWLVADVVNYITYVSFSEYWVGALIMPIGAGIVVIWGLIKLSKSKTKEKFKLSKTDWFAIVVSIVSLLVYWITQNGKLSNIMIQTIMAMGFVPIIASAQTTKKSEEPVLPWALFTVGWAVTIVDTIIGYQSLIEMVYPLVSIIGCGTIFVLILVYRKNRIGKIYY